MNKNIDSRFGYEGTITEEEYWAEQYYLEEEKNALQEDTSYGWDIVKEDAKELIKVMQAIMPPKVKPAAKKSAKQLEIDRNRKKCKFIIKKNGVNQTIYSELINWFRLHGDKFFKDNFKIVGNVLYAWKETHWAPAGDYIDCYIIKKFHEKFDIAIETKAIPEIITVCRHMGHIPEQYQWDWDDSFVEKVIITFNNGTLEVDLMNQQHQFYEGIFQKENKALFKLNHNFKNELLVDKFWANTFVGRYLLDFYEDAAREQLQQFLAAILIPQCELQQSLIILGEGGDGKGVLMGAIKDLLEKVVTELRVSEWEGKHDTSTLVGSILNITSEAPDRQINLDVWKSIVACDSLTINPKYEKPYSYKPFCKHIMTVNNLPKIQVDKAVIRRMAIIKTCKTTTEEERETFFSLKFRKDKDGLVSFILQGLLLLAKNKFKSLPGSADLREELVYQNESLITDFVNDCLDITGKKADRELSSELYDVFLYWKIKNGKNARDMTRSTFSKKVITVAKALHKTVVYSDSVRGSRIPSIQNSINNKTVRVLAGLKIRSAILIEYKDYHRKCNAPVEW